MLDPVGSFYNYSQNCLFVWSAAPFSGQGLLLMGCGVRRKCERNTLLLNLGSLCSLSTKSGGRPRWSPRGQDSSLFLHLADLFIENNVHVSSHEPSCIADFAVLA